MSSAVINIASINPPEPNKQQATIIDATGSKWKIWPNNLGGIEAGKRYSIEYTTSQFKGRDIHLITKAYPAEPVAGNGNGHAPSASPPNEMHFVTTLLAAFITSGQIKPGDKAVLWETVKMLRGCYAATFGMKETTH